MYETLWNEIDTDPLTRGYDAMSNAQIAGSLNTANRTRQRATLSSAEIYEHIDSTEFQAKTAAQKEYVRDILGLGENISIGPTSKARTVMLAVFGGGSTTITALAAAAQENISRATELGLPTISEGIVIEAKQYGTDN